MKTLREIGGMALGIINLDSTSHV